MARNNDFPGLQRVHRKDGSAALYWTSSAAAINAGFIPKTVRLDYRDCSAGLAKRCQHLEARMVAWLAEREKADQPIVFDGTIGGLIKIYLGHPASPFHERLKTTRQTYQYNLQKLNHPLGGYRLDQINGIDFRRWYERFKEPKQEGGPERVSGAHHLMEMLRIVLGFGVELGLPHVERLRDALSAIKFPDAPARSGRP
jgi:hypothetical protein